MRFPGLICSTQELATAQDPVIIDCRFDLNDTGWGHNVWRQDHIPGAHYAHLDQHLSGEIIPGRTGRHPLPDLDALCQQLQRWGISNNSLVVAYDQGPGAHAARLWWLLRHLGHQNVMVLDGGYARWTAESRPTTDRAPQTTPGHFTPAPALTRSVSASDITNDIQGDQRLTLIDAREMRRFEGRTEPIDPVAGHIPGARCCVFTENLADDGCFDLEAIKKRFEPLTDADLVCYCGSGVTATHNILAIRLAGLDEPALYAGSWSEWITEPGRPIATGPAS